MNRTLAIILTMFVAAGAAFGGIGLIVDGTLGMDPALLDGTPFSSYVVPGYILLFAVGGSNLVAGILLLINHEHAYSYTFLAGTILTVWIIAQVAMIGLVSLLQPVMLVLGVLTMLIAYRLWPEITGIDQHA